MFAAAWRGDDGAGQLQQVVVLFEPWDACWVDIDDGHMRAVDGEVGTEFEPACDVGGFGAGGIDSVGREFWVRSFGTWCAGQDLVAEFSELTRVHMLLQS